MRRIFAPRAASFGVLCTAAILAASCSGPRTNPRNEPWRLTAVPAVVRAGPDRVGSAVAIRGVVRTVLSRSAFTVGGPAPADQVLVVSREPDPTPLPLKTGQVVQVRGTLRVFNQEEFAEGYGLNFDRMTNIGVRDPFLASWIGRNAIDAGPIVRVYFEPVSVRHPSADVWSATTRPAAPNS